MRQSDGSSFASKVGFAVLLRKLKALLDSHTPS